MPSNTFATSGRDLVGHRIDGGRLEFLSVLGLGAYGVVYLTVDLFAPEPVYLAVKCLLRAGLDSRQRHFQRREIALHQLASRHPNVVTMHKVFEDAEHIYVVMDFCDEGDLFGMITERQRVCLLVFLNMTIADWISTSGMTLLSAKCSCKSSMLSSTVTRLVSFTEISNQRTSCVVGMVSVYVSPISDWQLPNGNRQISGGES
jgi:serine/threonine protein kinase